MTGVRLPAEEMKGLSHHVQTNSGTHPFSCPMGHDKSIVTYNKKQTFQFCYYLAIQVYLRSRTGQMKNAYEILVGKPEGKRPLGRS
jgi:hypothetical protein